MLVVCWPPTARHLMFLSCRARLTPSKSAQALLLLRITTRGILRGILGFWKGGLCTYCVDKSSLRHGSKPTEALCRLWHGFPHAASEAAGRFWGFRGGLGVPSGGRRVLRGAGRKEAFDRNSLHLKLSCVSAQDDDPDALIQVPSMSVPSLAQALFATSHKNDCHSPTVASRWRSGAPMVAVAACCVVGWMCRSTARGGTAAGPKISGL